MPCGGSPLPPGDNPWVAIIRWLSVHATAHTSVLSLLVGESAARAYFLAPGSAMPQILEGHQGESGEHEKRDPDGARGKGQHVGRVSLVPHEGGDEGVTRRFDPLKLADDASLIPPYALIVGPITPEHQLLHCKRLTRPWVLAASRMRHSPDGLWKTGRRRISPP